MACNGNIVHPTSKWKSSQPYPDGRVEEFCVYLSTQEHSKILSYCLAFGYEDIVKQITDSKNNPRTTTYFSRSREATALSKRPEVEKRVDYLKKLRSNRLTKDAFLTLDRKREMLLKKVEELLEDGGSAIAFAKLLELDSKLAGHLIEKKELDVKVSPLDEVASKILGDNQ